MISNKQAALRVIKAGNGPEIIVDASDYDWLNQWNWTTSKMPTSKTLYAMRKVQKGGKKTARTILMHRIIVRAPQGKVVDHINHNGLDNRRENLRICTRMENLRHRSGLQTNNTSGYNGVCWDKRKSLWMAKIIVKNKHKFIGYFKDKHLAAIAYNESAGHYFGEFKFLNKVPDKFLSSQTSEKEEGV